MMNDGGRKGQTAGLNTAGSCDGSRVALGGVELADGRRARQVADGIRCVRAGLNERSCATALGSQQQAARRKAVRRSCLACGTF